MAMDQRARVKPIAIPLPSPKEQTNAERLELEPGMILQTPRGGLYLLMAVHADCGGMSYYLTMDRRDGTIKGTGQVLTEYAARNWALVGRADIDISQVEWLV